LEECWLFFTEKAFEEFDTLIDGFIEASVVSTTDFMKFGFLLASEMEVLKLGIDTVLFITVKSENAFTLIFTGLTLSKFVIGTITGKFCVSNFSFTECFLFITINDLLGSKGVVFGLFCVNLIN